MFDATDLTWRLSEKKIAKAKNSIVSALSKEIWPEGLAKASRQAERHQSVMPFPEDLQVVHQ
jgi:hypothetical protein